MGYAWDLIDKREDDVMRIPCEHTVNNLYSVYQDLIAVLDDQDIEPIDCGELNAAALIIGDVLKTWKKHHKEHG
jgi:hypothetical protein